MEKRTPRPRDPNQLAKLITDIASGAVPDTVDDGKDPAAVSLGRKGGLKGGVARANKLSSEERSAIATAAAQKRWQKNQSAG